MALILASSASRKPLLPALAARPTRKPLRPAFRFPSHPPGRFAPQTLKCSSQRPQSTEEFERVFSNLNRATMKHEPGSLTSAILLVAGTTVGAGILAIPAVTQEAGFLPSAITCILCWIYMVVTGLLIAEVNVNTMCELGSGGVSLVSMAMRTLGNFGIQIACWSYIFIHYALLVAYVARSSDILTNSFGIPLLLNAGYPFNEKKKEGLPDEAPSSTMAGEVHMYTPLPHKHRDCFHDLNPRCRGVQWSNLTIVPRLTPSILTQ